MIRLRRDSLHSTFMVSMMMFAVLSAGCIVYLWLSHEYRNFNREMAALRHEFTMERKAASRSEVNRVFDYIEYQRSSTNRKLREMLRSRVYEATEMAEGIFNMYRDRKPPDEIGVMIREALRDVRFNDGRGYYFIYDMEGRNILLPFSPELEGRNLWDLQDSQGLYTIRRFVRIVREQGEGFLDWYWYKPGTREHMARKTGFARYFAPLDWWIGTGEYEADFEKDIQRDILDWIGKIRFGEDGYIFVYTDRGVNLAHAIPEYVGKNQWGMTDPDGLKMIQSLIHSAREPDGGYTSYIWKRPSTGKPGHKISYTRMFDPWKWVIGTGDYINSIEDRIALKQSGIREKIRLLMYRIVTMLTILLIIIFFVARYVSGKLVQNFTVFSDFFEKATEHSSRIDDAAVHFTEFRYLARCANRMIEQQALFQEALRESEERLNLTIRSTGQVLWDWDIATGKIVWDSQIVNLFEYSISEMTSLADWYSRVHPDDRPVLEKARSSHISGETVFFEAEYRIQGSGGQWKWVLDQGKVIRWDMSGHALRAVGTCMDITARKQAEQEKAKLQEQLDRSRKMEALGLLAGGVAHDLNNVLSGIVGYPELILMDLPPDSPIRAPVSAIAQSGQRAAAIVQDLLTLARRGVVQKETLSLNAVISEYLASPECRKLVADHPGLVIRQNLLPELFNIKGSPVHLKKTVMNLVMNAAEAQPNGGEVLITTENRYVDKPLRGYDTIQEGDFAVIRIEDQGVGISSDDLKRIFEPFYTRKIMGRSGTGLGMAVVWGTVQDHGGYINVDSIPGQGTVFELYFRAVREDVAIAGPPDSPDRYQGNGETLLVVDDIRQQRHIASHMLERLGYQVHTAAGGEEALEWLKTQTADLLIMDMIMDPGMDGLETYRAALHIYPEQKAIIASGFAETDRVREAQRLGAGAYIKKPYTLEELGKAVKTELERCDKKTAKPV